MGVQRLIWTVSGEILQMLEQAGVKNKTNDLSLRIEKGLNQPKPHHRQTKGWIRVGLFLKPMAEDCWGICFGRKSTEASPRLPTFPIKNTAINQTKD